MSANGKSPDRDAEQIDANLALVKAMGSTRGYNPFPPDQHEWQMAEGNGELHRIWSGLCRHTLSRGNRYPYANVGGVPLTLRQLAEIVGMEFRNFCAAWRLGEQNGLWRREGRRLYLNGTVKAPQMRRKKGEQWWSVQTTKPKDICNKIKELGISTEEEAKIWEEWDFESEAERRVMADAVAVVRLIFDTRKDTKLRAHGIEKNRLDKRPSQDSPLVQALKPVVEQVVEQYVQMKMVFVQTTQDGLYNHQNGSVQPVSNGASLFTSERREESVSSSPELYIKSQPAAAIQQAEKNGGGGTPSNSNGYAQFVKHCMEQCKFGEPGTPQLWERIKRGFGDAATDEILKYLIVLDGQDGPGLWASYSAEALRAMNGKQPKKLTRNEKLAAEVLAEMRGKAAKV